MGTDSRYLKSGFLLCLGNIGTVAGRNLLGLASLLPPGRMTLCQGGEHLSRSGNIAGNGISYLPSVVNSTS